MNYHASEPLPFFVYGTLLPGQPNDDLWGDGITRAEAAFLHNSHIYDMGYYPMLVSQSGGTVSGKLITVASLAYREIMLRLDALEEYVPARPKQSTYLRVRRRVTTKEGRRVDAWVYEGDMDLVEGMPQILGGDWLAHISSRHGEIEIWWESINSKFGHHKRIDGNG